jgi:hypothetical protein
VTLLRVEGKETVGVDPVQVGVDRWKLLVAVALLLVLYYQLFHYSTHC